MSNRSKSKAAPKAKRQPVKKVVIRWDETSDTHYFKSGAYIAMNDYARPFTAKRGATRHFRKFIEGGGKLVFVKGY